MEGMIILIALLVAGTVGYSASKFVAIADPNVAKRLNKIDQPAERREPIEWVSLPLSRLIPGYFKRIEQDLYWAAFTAPSWSDKTPAYIVGRQILMTATLGVLVAWLLGSNLGLWIGGLLGWFLMRSDLTSKASNARKRITQELPEFLQLMAAESASGAGLDAIMSRVSSSEGYLPAWLRRVLSIAHGRSLLISRETGAGILMQEAQLSGHPDLISFAIQMGFARQGTQVRETLTRLATQFSDSYVGQAEIRTERLASLLGVLVALFYFLPFLVVILVVIGVPLIRAFSG
ncbi:MAG: type II secretion system F family protein [Marinospirillum sp.]|uniref:type II secretion system F family protein n=1 Tax=Marinospirillum sp. TaxID=2183934 RepID=UPI0019E7C289|nr:type II secretion system F family protein [Marinospirillum sp.]MBE0508715.1 type II secretion system F family protein [Marinospirillum sp.]